MAFTFDAKVESNATSTGLTVSHTCTGASLLVVCIAIRGNQTISGVTYGGVALTSAVDRLDATDPERSAIWYLVNPAAGANNVVISLSGSVLHYVTVASFASGATPSLDVTASASDGTGTIANASCAVSGAVGGLAVDIASSENNANPPWSSAGGDQTVLHNTSNTSYGRGSSYELSPASNEQFDWTGATTNTWVQCVAVFKEGAAAATDTGPPPDGLFHELAGPGYGAYGPNPFVEVRGEVAAPAAPVSETPTPGGAVADGFSPTARVPVSQGGALADGVSPVPRTALTIGGATGGGPAPSAVVPVGQGGATAGGNAPGESSSISETPTPGGAVAGGFGPVARDTLTIGGAVAAGTAPAVSSTVTQGGATAAGFGPSPARVTFSIGGAVAGGFAPSEVGPNTPTPGGAIAGGFGPTARVSLTIGGATAGGFAPAQGNIVTIGGASTGGFGATVRVQLTIGGAVAGGFEPTIPVVTPLPPYVATRPKGTLGADSEGAVRSSGRSGGLSTAPRGRIRRG